VVCKNKTKIQKVTTPKRNNQTKKHTSLQKHNIIKKKTNSKLAPTYLLFIIMTLSVFRFVLITIFKLYRLLSVFL